MAISNHPSSLRNERVFNLSQCLSFFTPQERSITLFIKARSPLSSKWKMGFFQRLFGPKKFTGTPSSAPSKQKKRRWSFVKEKLQHPTVSDTSKFVAPASELHSYDTDGLDANKHAIAVAAATAAVAKAALAAAHAAAQVVRLTSRTGTGSSATTSRYLGLSHHVSAIKIQSAFRGYLVSNFEITLPLFFFSFVNFVLQFWFVTSWLLSTKQFYLLCLRC